MSIFSHYQQRYESTQMEEYSIQEYLELCKNDPSAYATAAERMLLAIGEPEMVDTAKDPRLNRIFSNKIIKRYPMFDDFYGMEECIENIVSFFRHAAQGLEEKKQILYLLGPVGGGKSSLAEKLKSLMEQQPIYALKDSPVYESPLGLFQPNEDGDILSEEYGIPLRYLNTVMSPWAVKTATRIRWRCQQIQSGQTDAVHSRSNRHIQNRTRRRKQPGHFLTGRQGGYSPAGRVSAARPGRLQFLRGHVSRQPGIDGICRNVQGTDKSAAPIAHRHPGKQLQRHRSHWCHSF